MTASGRPPPANPIQTQRIAPGRILRRAGNLLTSTGQPAYKELLLNEHDSSPVLADSPVSLGGHGRKLSASIRRKFREVKDVAATSLPLGRSKSLAIANSSNNAEVGNGNGLHNSGTGTKLDHRKYHSRSSSHSTTATATIHTHLNSVSTTTTTIPRLVHSNTAPADSTSARHSSHSMETPTSRSALMDHQGDITVPQLLQQGTPMTKVSSKKHKRAVFRLDADLGQIIWEGKQHRIIPLENIKELRSGTDARYYREQFQLAQEYEDRWLTIVYILDGNYKTLHLIAATKDVFRMWDTTLRRLHAVRQELMSGLGHIEVREAMWEKQHWKGADEERDQKLVFEEVEKLCKRLNINSSSSELLRLFKQADTQNRNYLDFEDFRRFVKLLKSRPEIDRLYKKLRARGGGVFDFTVFERFMREKQKSSLTQEELQAIFDRYSEPTPIPTSTPSTSSPPTPTPQRTMTPETFTSFLISPDNSAFTDQHGRVYHDMTRPLADYYISSSHNTYLVGHQLVGISTIEGYIRALLHSCRSVELDIYDGDQPTEPQIFHGKTFTSKVSLREVCHAIVKYGFVASPYPIIISAEVHCGLAGQDAIARIMGEVFGERLVRAEGGGVEGTLPHPPIDHLPSPEQLKGRILLKAKNVYLAQQHRRESGSSAEEYSTESSTSASDSDAVVFEGGGKGGVNGRQEKARSGSGSGRDGKEKEKEGKEGKKKRKESDTVKEFKDDLLKVGSTVFQRVRSAGKSSSSAVNMPKKQGSGSGSSSSSSLTQTFFGQYLAGSPPQMQSPLTLPSAPSSTSTPFSKALPPPSSFTLLPRTSSMTSSFTPTTPTPTIPVSASSALLPQTPYTPTSTTSLPPPPTPTPTTAKPKMSLALLSLLVYTVGVKCRGINKKEVYAPEHMFSLSETVANRMLKTPSSSSSSSSSPGPDVGGVGGANGSGMLDLIKHCRTHLVRVYPKGMRLSSTNYEPHRYWSAGAQLVAINWQTFDLGYMINHAMFQRNGRAGYVLKPAALRGPYPPAPPPPPHPHLHLHHSATPTSTPAPSTPTTPNTTPIILTPKDLLAKRTKHHFDVTIISAQQLPRPKDSSGREIMDKALMIDPYVEVSIHVPDWTSTGSTTSTSSASSTNPTRTPMSTPTKTNISVSTSTTTTTATPARTIAYRTGVVKNNGFNPVWEEKLRIPFDCVGDMRDLVFVRFVVRMGEKEDVEPLAVYCASLGSLGYGYRHLPLHDSQLSQYLFSTLFVRIGVTDL